MKNPKLNVDMLRRVQAWLREEPRRFSMGMFGHYWPKSERYYSDIPACGTVCCLAGTANLLDHLDRRRRPHTCKFDDVANAARLLGLEDALYVEDFGDKLLPLFFTDSWPKEYRERWNGTVGAEEEVEVACDLIDEVIRRRGLWWVKKPKKALASR